MNRFFIFLTILFLFESTNSNWAKSNPSKQPQQRANSTLVFVENKGQITDQHNQPRTDIDFRIGGSGVNLFVGNAALHYQWVQPAGIKVIAGDTSQEFTTYRMDVQLVGANPNAQVIKEQKQNFYEHYYTSQFGEQGATAYSYEKVTYKEIYPNVDWVLYVRNNTVEYDFVLRPGGKVSDIQLQYLGATKLAINKDGSLSAITPFGTLTEAAPTSFQQADGKAVTSSFVLNDNTLSFSTGSYTGTLVIDPVLQWATYYGGTGAETIRAGCISADNYGNGYFAGHTNSAANIATAGSHQATFSASTDAFLVKFNNAGVRSWATYFGGSGAEFTLGTATDATGNVYITGYTPSVGLATTGAHQATGGGGQDAFLVKFDSAGTRLWSTYYGGTGSDRGYSLICDKSNNILLGGTTTSAAGIATTGSFKTTNSGGTDAFLVKFDSAGTRQWATYYGGTGSDQLQAICSNDSNHIYIAGYTVSATDIASAGSYQPAYAGVLDGFLVKFDSTGNRLWGTYYGGTDGDELNAVTCDAGGAVYIAGTTLSTSGIATANGFQQVNAGGAAGDAFLVKFNAGGNRVWGTYYGGTANEAGHNLCYSPQGNIYMTGSSTSNNGIATPGTYKDTVTGAWDAFIVRFDTAGNRAWATYYGGELSDIGYGIFCNSSSELFIAGSTQSNTGIATAGSHQPVYGGNTFDGFVLLFNDCAVSAPLNISGSDTVCAAATHQYTVAVVPGATSYTWLLPNGWAGSSSSNSISIQSGTQTDTIRVAANFPCGISDTIAKVVTVTPAPVITPSGNSAVCSGDSIILSTGTGLSYQWLESGMPVSGATNQTLTVHTAGTYSVVVTAVNNCTDTSLAQAITVNPLPEPVITVSGSVLSTGSYSSYQWNHNGSHITGAVNAAYTMTLNTGDYTVTVTDANDCSGTSAPYSPALSINDKEKQGIKVYPNPVRDILLVESPVPVNISIRSIDGRLAAEYDNATSIDVSHLPAGIYTLHFTDLKGRYISTGKMIKTGK